jgi:hypothetical protein
MNATETLVNSAIAVADEFVRLQIFSLYSWLCEQHPAADLVHRAAAEAGPQRTLAKCCLSNTGLKTAFAAVQNSCSALPVGTCELM